ncbi:hypothetical protein AKJ09_07606 [Labilithrix luteola]|uniref:Uncharacterized protein n=1 Tax=Labilithrix luteola TaxID=1391654 RepID=A0A0K1Q5D3_9BACT|nr:hypothetical protein AKJ09_07606 [Labilithrix luteola]
MSTVPPSADGPDAEITAQAATGVVVVERVVAERSGDTLTHDAHADTIVARFVRVRQGIVDAPALRIAGVAQDLPALGTCTTDTDDPLVQKPRAVDLLDVGPVSLDDLQGRSTLLLPRSMPDPAGVVSGVFYTARATEAFAPGGHLELHASGGPDLADGFVVNVAAPQDVRDVVVSSNASGGLDVAWDATDADPRDLVYVEVLGPSSRPSSRVVTRCTTQDIGHVGIPESVLGRTSEGQLAVHRVHRESFRTKGIDPGEVRFDVSRVVSFRR